MSQMLATSSFVRVIVLDLILAKLLTVLSTQL
jgi:hypothetical protein